MLPKGMMQPNTSHPQPSRMEDCLPRPLQPQRQQQPIKPKGKPPAPATKTKTKTKKTQVAPLPATVQVKGYEINIPNTKTCWRVCVLHACGHPVIEVSAVRYPGCDRPLVISVNRHMRPCSEKCKVEALDHVVGTLCEACLRLSQEESHLMGGNGGQGGGVGHVGEASDGTGLGWLSTGE